MSEIENRADELRAIASKCATLQEFWKAIPGWEGFYEVSSAGNVRSIDRVVQPLLGGPPQKRKGQDLKLGKRRNGYLYVSLRNGETGMSRSSDVHRLVALAFLANPEGKPNVNHLDNSRDNNAVENLEWCTQQENLQHMRQQGRGFTPFKRGVRSHNALLTNDEVMALRVASAAGETVSAIGRRFKVSRRTVKRVASGEYYSQVAA